MRHDIGDDIEVLVQRFLDGELDRAGRQTLLRRLGEDAGLRQRLMADEAMLEAVADQPRLAPSPDFVARTKAGLPEQPDQQPDTAVTTPARRSHSRWIPAVAAAAIVLAAAGFWAGRTYVPSPADNAAIAPIEADVPEVLVRVVLIQPDAQTVAIVGDFNGWDPGRSPLERIESGGWSTTLELSPGRYHYMFLVDGDRWLPDPLAVETTSDGFGALNSVLDVGA